MNDKQPTDQNKSLETTSQNRFAIVQFPRFMSILFGTIAMLFLVSPIQNITMWRQIVSVVVFFAIIAIIIKNIHEQKNWIFSTLFPIAILGMLLMYYILGGYSYSLNFIQFIFLGTLAGFVSILNFLAWKHPMIGGVMYAAFALMYFVVSYGKLQIWIVLLLSGLLLATSILYFLQQTLPENKTKNEEEEYLY